MIKISGDIARSFTFPANIETAYDYYREVPQLIAYLPHIELVGQSDGGRHFRVKYSTKELNAYQINIYCDLEVELDEANHQLFIRAVDSLPAIQPETTMSSTTGRGYFSCHSYFHEIDPESTRIEYELNIHAKLATPKGLRFMPGRMVSGIARGITNGRVKEIADGFVNNSIAAYEHDLFGELEEEM